MKNLVKSLFVVSLCVGFLSSCATTTDPADAYKGETPQEIFIKGKSALISKNFSESVKRFEALDIQYPFGQQTEQAQLYIIYAYYMKEDHALAGASADRFIRLHPTNPHVDYALYMKGLADFYQSQGFIERTFNLDLSTRDLVQIQKAFTDFNELNVRFPHSIYRPYAQQYMVYLRNLLAAHELQVAKYYYGRKAYLAAANRAAGVVKHFQGAPQVKEALQVMQQSYQVLGLSNMNHNVSQVLEYNR